MTEVCATPTQGWVAPPAGAEAAPPAPAAEANVESSEEEEEDPEEDSEEDEPHPVMMVSGVKRDFIDLTEDSESD